MKAKQNATSATTNKIDRILSQTPQIELEYYPIQDSSTNLLNLSVYFQRRTSTINLAVSQVWDFLSLFEVIYMVPCGSCYLRAGPENHLQCATVYPSQPSPSSTSCHRCWTYAKQEHETEENKILQYTYNINCSWKHSICKIYICKQEERLSLRHKSGQKTQWRWAPFRFDDIIVVNIQISDIVTTKRVMNMNEEAKP